MPETRPHIVLVHGAWADGSSWNAVLERLHRDGFTATAPSNTLRGVTADAAGVRAYLESLEGPIVLVGHSYGGFVITNAATGNPNVKALVYVDAFIPDEGQVVGALAEPRIGADGGAQRPDVGLQARRVPRSAGRHLRHLPAAAGRRRQLRQRRVRRDGGAHPRDPATGVPGNRR